MEFVHNNGGKAIFVHQPHKDDLYYNHNNKIYQKLKEAGIADYCFVADYRENTELLKALQ